MDVMMVRAKVKEESVADVEAAVKTMFGTIDAASRRASAMRHAGYPTV